MQRGEYACYLVDSIAITVIHPRHNVNSTRSMRPAIMPVSLKLVIQSRSRARAKVTDREKLAQSETSTRASSPSDAPCPSTTAVRSSAYGCTRLNKHRLILAFLSLLPSNRCLQPMGYKFPRHHRLFSPHPYPFQFRLTRRPHPPRKSRQRSRCRALPYRRNLQLQSASFAPPVELDFDSVLSRFLTVFVTMGSRVGMNGFISPYPRQNTDLLLHVFDLSRQCGGRGRKAFDPYLTHV